MTFRSIAAPRELCPGGCEEGVIAIGRITSQTPSAFRDYQRSRSGARGRLLVVLDSPGGSVVSSMEFGDLLRQDGETVVVARVAEDDLGRTTIAKGICYSACVYAFLGGRTRVIPAGSRLGVHRMFLSVEGIDQGSEDAMRQQRSDDSAMRSLLASYTVRMGVNAALITEAERTASDKLHILTETEIRKWNVGIRVR